MANSDKNIVITPNRSLSGQPQIAFTGFGNVPITLKVLDDTNGTLSFEGSAGQLFSINNNLTSGSIFSVNDVSGIPSFDVNANGTVHIAAFGGNVGIGKTNPSTKLDVTGTVTATAFSGPLTGNASTATTLQTARTINGTSFNGSANITITANTPNTLTRGTYLTGNNFNGGAATTWAVDATSANTASKVVARDGSGNFSAGSITTVNDSYFNSMRLGAGPGGTNNLVLGNNAGASLTAGTAPQGNENIAIGNFALDANTTGYYNTAIGYNALTNVIVGFRCTAVGWNALANSTGDRNTAVGANALGATTTGTFNVAVGNNALGANTEGGGNMAIGNAALNGCTTGGSNTAIGTGALFGVTTTNNNVGLGNNAGRWLLDGTTVATQLANCVYIGGGIRANSDNESNSIVIGANQNSDGSNTTIIGTSSTTATRIPSGNFTVTSGSVTATSFIGNLNHTLTLNTSGTGLSGSTTFNNSGAATFTVTSNATNANTASTLVARDGSGNFSAGTITATLSGSATRLTNFTSTTTTSAGSDNSESAVSYIGSLSPTLFGQTDGALYSHVYSSAWKHNIFGDYRTGQLAVRGKNNGTWTAWRTILDSTNYSDYAPSKTGSGASGSWGISVTGNAGTATTLATGRTIGMTGDVSWTSASFNGSGNVTGTATLANSGVAAGSYTAPTITVDAKGRVTAASSNTIPTVNNGTLTLAVSGTGLSGSQTFTANQSSDATFTVTSNATSANTANAIVARDGSGNFSATSVVATNGFQVGSGAINAKTAGYTLIASDNGKIITINSASAVTLTVGTAAGTAGFSCTVIQLGAGQVTIAASGTTLNSASGLKLAAQHAAASIVCYTANTFNVAGNLTT